MAGYKLLPFVLFFGTVLLYLPIVTHGFINYDDPDYILDNPHVKAGLTWPGIVWAFKSSSYAANWHPLTWISHMLDCQAFGLNPQGHHLMNVLFHAANSTLLFMLLYRMTGARWRSFFVAALFAWHPLHVESVAWASERKDVLSGFFWMLTLICYARYGRFQVQSPQSAVCSPFGTPKPSEGASSSSKSFENVPLPHPDPLPSHPMGAEREQQLDVTHYSGSERQSPPQVESHPQSSILNPCFAYSLSLFFFACGLMSKPMVVTLPCVLFLLDFWPLQRFNTSTVQRLILEKLPFFALAAGSCAITLFAQHNAMWSTASLPFSFRVANTVMSYVRYLSKIFLPTNLALIYPYPHSWPLSGVLGAGIVLLALTIVFVFQAKRYPYLVVGWFWFLGTLVPVIGLVQVGVQSMADRYTYLPSIGIFILATWAISDLVARSARRLETCAIVGGCALIACLVLMSIQLSYWRNSLTIFSHTVLVTTDNYAADDCLGKTLHNLGAPDKAQPFYDEAIRLEPGYPLAQFDSGINLLSLNDAVGASNHLATAVQLWPGNAVMQYDFGVFLSRHGQPQMAADHLKAALANKPDFPEARKELDSLKR